MVPEDLKYTKEHEWVKIEGSVATIGITDHAQTELGDITFVELPDVGKDIKQSDSCATVESVKAASDIYAPVSGKISEANDILANAPETINQSPYGEGWICKIDIANAAEANSLMDAQEYEAFLKEG